MLMDDANEGIVKYTVSGILPYCLAVNLFALNRKHTATFAFFIVFLDNIQSRIKTKVFHILPMDPRDLCGHMALLDHDD